MRNPQRFDLHLGARRAKSLVFRPSPKFVRDLVYLFHPDEVQVCGITFRLTRGATRIWASASRAGQPRGAVGCSRMLDRHIQSRQLSFEGFFHAIDHVV
jgi:hypothetical protein